jgi:hypothetical protein
MTKHTVIMHNAQQGHGVLLRMWDYCKPLLLAGHKLVLTAAEETRNSEQNALLWVLLTAFSDQLKWPVNGQMVKLSPEEWKDLLSAAYKRESQRIAMGIDGGMVMLGMRTSKMGKREFAEFIDFINATAALRGVQIEHEESTT